MYFRVVTCVELKQYSHIVWNVCFLHSYQWTSYHTHHKHTVCRQCVSEGVFLSYTSNQTTSHKRHICGVSHLCELVDDLLNFFCERMTSHITHHTSQENSFSPVCVRMCVVRCCFCEHVYSQWEHVYGLTSECVTMCFVRFVLSEQVQSHTS